MSDDMEILEKEIHNVNEKWTKLQQEISEKLHNTNQMGDELTEFQECVTSLDKVSEDVTARVKTIQVFAVPEESEIDFKNVEIKRRIVTPEDSKKDLEIIEVS